MGCPFANNTNLSTEAHIPTPQYGQYLTHAHKHITPLMDSCFVLIRTHEHGIAPGERFHLRSFTPLVKRRVQICSANVGWGCATKTSKFVVSLHFTKQNWVLLIAIRQVKITVSCTLSEVLNTRPLMISRVAGTLPKLTRIFSTHARESWCWRKDFRRWSKDLGEKSLKRCCLV